MIRVFLIVLTILFSINSFSQLKGEVLDHKYYWGLEIFAGLNSTNFNDLNTYYKNKYDSNFGGTGVLYGFDFNVRHNYSFASINYNSFVFDGFEYTRDKYKLGGYSINTQAGYAAFPNEANFDLNAGTVVGYSSLKQTVVDEAGIEQDDKLAKSSSVDFGVFIKPVYRTSSVAFSINAGYIFDFSGGKWKTNNETIIIPDDSYGRLFIQMGVGFFITTDESTTLKGLMNSR